MDADLSVIVYRGDPVDLQKTRHTALFITFADRTTVLIHTVGAAGFFSVEQRPGEQPTASRKFVAKIEVGTIKGKTKDQVRLAIGAVPVNNNSREWNCQNWVGDVLTRLVSLGWIKVADRTAAFSKMVDVTMEAEDESDA